LTTRMPEALLAPLRCTTRLSVTREGFDVFDA
jgi:hypothetical protein